MNPLTKVRFLFYLALASNVLLLGPPGTGKTMLSKRWEKNPGFSMIISSVDDDDRPEILALADRAVLLELQEQGTH
jgi:hypothetical protein